jgi:hypothetical protein
MTSQAALQAPSLASARAGVLVTFFGSKSSTSCASLLISRQAIGFLGGDGTVKRYEIHLNKSPPPQQHSALITNQSFMLLFMLSFHRHPLQLIS